MVFDKKENKTYTYEQHIHHTRYLDSLKQEFVRKYSINEKDEKLVEDFDFLRKLGVGAFGKVLLGRDKNSLEYHAIKVLEKTSVIQKNSVKQLLFEKKIMRSVSFPFLVTLDFCCKDNLHIYLIMPFQAGGELFSLMKKLGNFSEPLAQFYAAQVVLALEYLHHCCVVHRDIKPENIFINESGYIKLGDFGFCKVIKTRTWSLCGTPEYIAPEIILSKGYSYSVDWWSMGILIYEMNVGYPPFYSTDTMELYEKILSGSYKCPKCVSPACKSLVKSLLDLEPTKRIGSLKAGVYDIKNHVWFHDIIWNDILHQKCTPPYMPICKNAGDANNFSDQEEIKIKTSPICLFEKEFENF